ncbi:hypothetical protein Naga_100564g3 [Nannochloropsis gaditana]|uniref:Uncharacterized protein n=1 Tax=Nannochloropsis gaditana TaxID=72520 RepID=W7TLG4_9STRA|nr:hypothetical protein Naga_100564g3 [Nannochloropsis gaditana]
MVYIGNSVSLTPPIFSKVFKNKQTKQSLRENNRSLNYLTSSFLHIHTNPHHTPQTSRPSSLNNDTSGSQTHEFVVFWKTRG